MWSQVLPPISRRDRWQIKGLIEEKENTLIVNTLFVQNVRGKSIPIIQRRRTTPWQEKLFLLICLDEIETVDRIKSANFQLRYFSNGSSFIRWENGERLRLHPNFNPHPIGPVSQFFSGKKVTAPPSPPQLSPKVPVRLCLSGAQILYYYLLLFHLYIRLIALIFSILLHHVHISSLTNSVFSQHLWTPYNNWGLTKKLNSVCRL